MGFTDRLAHAWNAFKGRDPTPPGFWGSSSGYRPDRMRFSRGNERSIITAVYNRIAIDVSAITIQHIQTDGEGRFSEVRSSGLNECLTLSANVDQTGRAFLQDLVQSMFDEGCVAAVPIDTDDSPEGENTIAGSFDVDSIRAGKIIDWMPKHVRLYVYNELTGRKEEIVMPKKAVAIIENPFYSIMNESNSTVQRLIRKLNLLDAIDEQSGSGKLDMIIQLPYVVRSDARKKDAQRRRKELEDQLANGKYGIAYIDGTEKVTQLNRSVGNNLMSQIEYLVNLMYSQLGITQSIMDGTADEATMLNYYNRTIEPIVSAIADEMKRKFLTKTARTQGQSIFFYRDPFKLVPVSQVAEIADKFTRNEVMSPNEVRQVIGLKPSKDPTSDELRNRNLSESNADVKSKTEEIVKEET